jgi:hypothetical protein
MPVGRTTHRGMRVAESARMPSTILPAVSGIAPELTIAAPLAALGPIVWACTSLAVLLIAAHLTRSKGRAPASDWPPSEPPVREAA